MNLNIDKLIRQGESCHDQGNFKGAEEIFRKVIKLIPNHFFPYFKLGVTLFKLNRLPEAEIVFSQSKKLKSDFVDTIRSLGLTLYHQNKLDEAEENFREVIGITPESEDAYNNLGSTLDKQSKHELAIENYKKAIDLNPDYLQSYFNLGGVLKRVYKFTESEECYRKAISINPDFIQAYNNLAALLQDLGRFEEAKDLYSRVLELNPSYVAAHYNYSQLKQFDKYDIHLVQMKKLYLGKSLSEEEHGKICFALGKAYENLNKFDQSFKYYKEGNGIIKKLLDYNIRQDRDFFCSLKKAYPKIKKNALKRLNLISKPKPIFILGMPRSGTTLVEQIVSSHSQVVGAGELPYIEWFGNEIAQGLVDINKNNIETFRKMYLEKIQNICEHGLSITDKMPLNFRYVGLIFAAFPEAKIIHVKRDPSATCWGNYKQFFSNRSIGFCYSLSDIVSFFNFYKDIMQFWIDQSDTEIYELDYEKLTVSQEFETRNLIKYLGLNWEKECLSPQNNKRSIHTASSVQIRRSVYQGSSEQWKKFKPYLDDTFRGLND